MMGFGLLRKLFSDEEAQKPQKTEAVVKVVVAEVKPAISEPVISLAKSILETDDWVLENNPDENYDSTYIVSKTWTFRHKIKNLQVPFVFTTKIEYCPRYNLTKTKTCACGWMSDEERAFMLTVLEDFRKKQTEAVERERQRQLAVEREKFMVLVTNQEGE